MTGLGRLELASRPLVLTMDGWPTREESFQKLRPSGLAREVRDRALAAVVEAIGRIAQEGDVLARIERKADPLPELAGRYWTERRVTADDLKVSFVAPPEIAWQGGGVEIRYQSGIDLRL